MITTGANGGFPNGQSYLRPGDIGGIYDGTSSDSSAASPLYAHGYENLYGETSSAFLHHSYPIQDPVSAAAMGLIPVELDIEGLYETEDRRRKSGGSGSSNGKVVPPHVHSRRRAQNRASQRAFRDRKEKRMREIEEKLNDLQGRHSDLTQSYESLQLEYSSVQQELEMLRSKQQHERAAEQRSYAAAGTRTWDGSRAGPSDPLMFDVSGYCYPQGGEAALRGERC